ncbi:MAG: hypothetical protein ACO3RV_09450, partial [Luteolibacter sp.]
IAWRSALSMLALSCAFLLIPAGWKASHVISILWPTYLAGKKDLPLEKRIDALNRAIQINPTPALIGDRAKLHHQAAATATEQDNILRSLELALADYRRAEQLHPFEPFYPINRGRLLGSLGRNQEAVETIQRGIQLQGGMEAGFRGYFMLAMHHLERSQIKIDSQTPEDILGHLTAAAAANLRGGRKIHYRTALLRGKLALDDWTQGRIKEALTGFSEARRLVNMAGGDLPDSFDADDRKEYIRYLDTVCGLLKKSVSQLEQQ